MNRLVYASLVTLTLLFGFVFSIVMAIAIYLDYVNVPVAIGLTILINGLLWGVGPIITDWINRFFYQVRFIAFDEFKRDHPEAAGVIEMVAGKYHFSIPRIGIIPDQNPTAFTYGSHQGNARIILTEGLFSYLNPAEVKSVVAHELGHIVNRDFIVMMVGSTLVQILYEIYASLAKGRSRGGGKKGDITKLIAWISYVFYIIGIYLLYYLSRTREYLADEFAVSQSSASDLSRALLKIAYGIVAAEDSDKTTRLLHSTRHLGLIDVKNARNIGVVTHVAQADPQVIAEVMVFDLVSPWAMLSEISSTHPLTGKRLLALAAQEPSGEVVFDLAGAVKSVKVDKTKLWSQFWVDLVMGYMPLWLLMMSLLLLPWSWLPGMYGLGLILSLAYRYPAGETKASTLLAQLRNPYASPIRGIPVHMTGKVIGRGQPGYVLSEDMMFQDATGLIYLNYVSSLGLIGNLFFAVKKVKALMGLPAVASGWFYRGLSTSMTLKGIEAGEITIKSHPQLWSLIFAFLLISISGLWILFM